MVKIYYDGDCPFCSAYTRLTTLRSSVGEVQLVNLREDVASRNRFQSEGFDLDQGMVVEHQGNIYYGDKAVNILSTLSSGNGPINAIGKLLLSNSLAAALLYPLMSLFRNITLFLLGRSQFSSGRAESEGLQTIFSVCLGIFSCLHLIVYATQFNAPLYWSSWMIPVVGLLLVCRPKDYRLLLVLICIMAIDGVRQMPTLSNHTIIKNFLVFAMIWSFLVCIKKANIRLVFGVFAPTGRALLFVMYFFGVFHKINAGFLNPDVSCAVALWQDMPKVFSSVDHIYAHYLFIYGTLVIESVILFFLFFGKTRRWGIFFGVGFHSILAISGYAFYPPFSTLTIVLHLLFITPAQADILVSSSAWKKSFGKLQGMVGVFLLIFWAGAIGWIASHGDYSNAALLWLIFPIVLMWVMVSGHSHFSGPLVGAGTLRSSSTVLNFIALAFLFNGWMPYMGLKSAQAMNMFANLQLENNLNNHLIMRHVEMPFDFLDDVVLVTESRNSEKLRYHRIAQLPIVYHDLLATLSDNPQSSVSYVSGNVSYIKQNSQTLSEEINKVVLPAWMRGFFHFVPVDLTVPKPCALDR